LAELGGELVKSEALGLVVGEVSFKIVGDVGLMEGEGIEDEAEKVGVARGCGGEKSGPDDGVDEEVGGGGKGTGVANGGGGDGKHGEDGGEGVEI
jgi:hypothetical protein